MNSQNIVPGAGPVPHRQPSAYRSSTLANIKWILFSLLMLLAVAGAIVGGLLLRQPTLPPVVSSAGISIAALKDVARLTVLEVPMTDVVTSERTGPLRLGSQRCRLTIHGVAEIGSDLQQGKFVEVDDAGRSAMLVLPTPTVLSVRVDHERSRVYDIDRGGLWQIVPGEIGSDRLVNAAYTKAEEMLRQAASTAENIERAKQQAARVISEACARMGWRVTLRWGL